MATQTQEVGARPVETGTYNASIDAATTITLPTPTQRPRGGVMTLILSVETQDARITFDGTNPTASAGILLAAPGVLTIRGERAIDALKIIGVAAGGKINYAFTVDDNA